MSTVDEVLESLTRALGDERGQAAAVLADRDREIAVLDARATEAERLASDAGARATTAEARVAELVAQLAAVPRSWERRSTTGAPARGLTVHDGDLTVTTPGAVIENVDVRGYLRIKAPGVTVRRTFVRGRSGLTGPMALVQVQETASGALLEDVSVAADYPSYYIDGIVIAAPCTLRRADIHRVVDSVKIISDDVIVEDSWLHDNLYFGTVPSGGDTHTDNVQVGRGSRITVRRTVLTGSRNAAVMVTQDNGAVSDLTVEDCLLDDGAATVNIAEKTRGPVKGVRLVGNGFGRKARSASMMTPRTTSSIATITGNTYPDGTPVPVTRG